jgi:hypothetical protein
MAFVVERDMKQNVLDFKAVEERMFVLRIKSIFQNISHITVYVATGEREGLEKEAFCQKVEEMYDSCSSNDIQTVLGTGTSKWEGK